MDSKILIGEMVIAFIVGFVGIFLFSENVIFAIIAAVICSVIVLVVKLKNKNQ